MRGVAILSEQTIQEMNPDMQPSSNANVLRMMITAVGTLFCIVALAAFCYNLILSSGTKEAVAQEKAADVTIMDKYDMYEEYLNQDVWPRPYTASEDQDRLKELRTDIFNLVNEKRADWITGKSDIDAEWDQFQADLITAGIDEFVEIMQSAYDFWYDNYSKVAGK